VPDYLLDPKTQEASKLVKLSKDAMRNSKSMCHEGSKRKFRKTRDPLKTFSAEIFSLLYFIPSWVWQLISISQSYYMDMLCGSSCLWICINLVTGTKKSLQREGGELGGGGGGGGEKTKMVMTAINAKRKNLFDLYV
jgi:hypothetical protein